MQQTEKFKDWLFRYQHIYRLRRTEKGKRRFLAALAADLAAIRPDVQVIEYDRQKKSAVRNVYVGDIAKAKQVICTYYDTPPQNFGSYIFFDRKEQGRRTMNFIVVSVLLALLLGIGGTLLYMKNVSAAFDLTSAATWFFMLLFGGYFFLLGQIARGLSNRKTLVRNTSSILTMMALIDGQPLQDTAFAFVDEGCYGERGLADVQASMKKGSQLFCLDCIGAAAPLQLVGSGVAKERAAALGIQQQTGRQPGMNYLFSAQKQAEKFYLSKAELQQALNMENIGKVVALFQ